ncbi:response regulator transcription factor [Eggerthella sinensis]|jgi:DNA-binding response OmpR family regulator|uniref:response regulator transcription factor n=1 Tax=Eggerthella sinensis TaxID=242230 RepID=UPI0029CA381D|nr:response regulator transcription factor [Eggerthella sinensis]
MNIMLADDDEGLRQVIERIVVEDGYDFCCAGTGSEALALYEAEHPDLVILDVMMPELNGFDVCSELRKRGSKVPVLFLSAKGDIVDKSVGFKAGADDYLVKPFSPVELSLRIGALLRRYDNERAAEAPQAEPASRIAIGDVEVLLDSYEVRVRGKAVDLTSKEFEIVALLASSPGKVFTREQILEHIWGQSSDTDLRSITVFVRKIREKIEDNPSTPRYLLTVWRVGYKFCDEV